LYRDGRCRRHPAVASIALDPPEARPAYCAVMPDTLDSAAPIAHHRFVVSAADGVAHTASEWSSAGESPQAPVFVLLPALGVPGGYYEPFARMLAQWRPAVVVLTDLRGQGTSTAPPRQADFGYREMLELDFPALFATIEARHGSRPLIVAGHSLGGQLAAVYAGCLPAGVAGLALLAAGSTHIAAWTGLRRIAVSGYTSLVRGLGAALPWYPGKLVGFGGDHPKRLIRDWGHVVKTGRYEPEGSTVDYEAACRRATMPVLSMGVQGDPMVPPAARKALTDRMPLAPLRSVEVPRPAGVSAWRSHFAWARKPDHVVAAVHDWMATLSDLRAASEERVAAARS